MNQTPHTHLPHRVRTEPLYPAMHPSMPCTPPRRTKYSTLPPRARNQQLPPHMNQTPHTTPCAEPPPHHAPHPPCAKPLPRHAPHHALHPTPPYTPPRGTMHPTMHPTPHGTTLPRHTPPPCATPPPVRRTTHAPLHALHPTPQNQAPLHAIHPHPPRNQQLPPHMNQTPHMTIDGQLYEPCTPPRHAPPCPPRNQQRRRAGRCWRQAGAYGTSSGGGQAGAYGTSSGGGQGGVGGRQVRMEPAAEGQVCAEPPRPCVRNQQRRWAGRCVWNQQRRRAGRCWRQAGAYGTSSGGGQVCAEPPRPCVRNQQRRRAGVCVRNPAPHLAMPHTPRVRNHPTLAEPPACHAVLRAAVPCRVWSRVCCFTFLLCHFVRGVSMSEVGGNLIDVVRGV